MNTKTKTIRPRPLDELGEEALLEFHRVCDELESIGKLATTDRAVLTLYCQTWAVWRDACRHVATHGAVYKLPNGIPAQNPLYKIQKETAAQLRGLLTDLCLNPAARGASAPAEEEGLGKF